MSSQWTPEAIRALGATTDLPTLGSILGVSRWKAYQMAQTGEWDQVGIRIVPIGAKYRVAVQSILEVLGYSDTPVTGTGTGHEPSAPRHTQAPRNRANGATMQPSGPVFPVTQNEHEGDVQDEQVEPDIPGVYPAVRAHGGGVLLTVSRRAALAASSWSW